MNSPKMKELNFGVMGASPMVQGNENIETSVWCAACVLCAACGATIATWAGVAAISSF